MQKTILVMNREQEDNAVFQEMREILQKNGYRLIQVRGGQDTAGLMKTEGASAFLVASGLFNGEELRVLTQRLDGAKPRSGAGSATASGASQSTGAAAGGDSQRRRSSDVTDEKLKAFQSMFQAVKLKYARGLPDKVQELAGYVIKAKAEPELSEHRDAVKQLSHKLFGTAGSYGYEKFAQSMKSIETTIMEIPHLTDVEDYEKAWNLIDGELVKGKAEAESISTEAVETKRSPDDEDKASHFVHSFAKVLMVDRDEAFLDVVEQLGRACNVAVVRSSNHEQALNVAMMHQLDAAIVDVNRDDPESSFRLALDLRTLPGYDTLPLAFVADDPNVKPQVEAAHAGASLYLDKPFDATTLEAAVRHLVSIRQGGRPRVMIVDDDPDFSEKMALDLRNDNLLVKVVNDPLKVTDALIEFPPDVMLLDVMMPSITGFELCQQLRQMPRWRDLPIIFITGETNVEARVQAFTSGGDDYLPKPVITQELMARVRVRLDKSRLMKERSDKDTITGLLLRRAFVEQVSAMLADAERMGSIFTVCLMDVDHFKKVNDTYGHFAGDRVLAGFGQLLLRRFRVDDLRGRWGGEEFILAFRRENKETMCGAVLRVLEEFSNMVFEADDGRQFSVTFSGGMASFPEDGKTLYELLTKADERLYDAKHAGRRRVHIASNVETKA